MNTRKIILLVNLISMLITSAFAGIIYNGNEYTETDMPFSKDGSGIFYYVVSGTINSVNSWNMRSLTINGVSYTNTWSSTMPAPIDGKKYFIVYEPKNKFAHFEIDGTNDWSNGGDPTAIDTIAIDLPYEHNGAERVCFSTPGTINFISSWGMDTLQINGVDYTNLWSDVMPERIDGMYYIYYSTELSYGHLELDGNNTVPLPEADTVDISLPFSFDGVGHHYFVTTEDIESISSWEADSVNVNGLVITNQTRTTMPAKVNGKYYIYYKGSQGNSHLEIAKYEEYPEIVNYNGQDYNKVLLPYSTSGATVQYVYTYGDIDYFTSSSMTLLEINGVNYTDQTSTTAPVSIDGKYFITYIPKNRHATFDMTGSNDERVYILNIKVFLQSAVNGH
jgi:Carbohydrate-binding module 64